MSTAERSPSALRNPTVRRIFCSDFVSRIGSSMSALALPWFVLVSSHSATRMGLVFAIELAPTAILGIPAARLVEKLGVRRTVVYGDALQAVLYALLPILHQAGLLPFWLLLVIVAITGAISAPYFTAQRLLLPEALGTDSAEITAANAWIEGSTWSARLIGPAVAGALIAAIGAMNVIWIDGVSFVVSAALLYGLPKRATVPPPSTQSGQLEGVRYVTRDSVVGRITLAATLYGLFVPVIVMAMPILALQRYNADPHVAGWLASAWGGGAVAGSLLVAPLVKRMAPLRLGAVAGIPAAAALWFLAPALPAYGAAIALLISGISTPLINAPLISVLSTRPPGHLVAQVISLVVTANLIAGPVAYLAAGPLFSGYGPGPVMTGVAVGFTVAACILVSLGGWRTPVVIPQTADDTEASAPAEDVV